MPPPSYAHRHLLLGNLLDEQDILEVSSAFRSPPHSGFDGAQDHRSVKLDTVLLRGLANGKRASEESRDVLQHIENLRLKKSDFEMMGRVGEGQFGVVDAVRCRLDGKVYAMKTIDKVMATRAGQQLSLPLERHIHILAHMDHNNPVPIPEIITAFQTPASLHLITTYAPCGTLWDRLCDLKPFGSALKSPSSSATGKMSESEVRWWAAQMMVAIAWVHGEGFAHRDIKPHNFLLFPDSRLMLTDFGSAAPLINPPSLTPLQSSKPSYLLKQYCLLPSGTPDYVAPEILQFAEDAMIATAMSIENDQDGDKTIRQSDITGQAFEERGYDASVDWWSLGVCLFEMVYGVAPFFAKSIGETYEMIVKCEEPLRFPTSVDASDGFMDLISNLLVPNARRMGRLGAWQIQQHPFFASVSWNNLTQTVPADIKPPDLIDLGTLANSFEQTENLTADFQDEITFDHFFRSSPGLTTMSMSAASVRSTPPPFITEPWHKWVGWSWDPPPDFFGSEPPSIPSPPPLNTQTTDPRLPFTTPLRPTTFNKGVTSATRSAPRSISRTRPVSERQAFHELVRCVQMSARKKVVARGRVKPSLKERPRSRTGRVEIPPTPTPAAKPKDSSTSGTTLLSVRSKREGLNPEVAPQGKSTVIASGPSLRLGTEQENISTDGRKRTLVEMEEWHKTIENGLNDLSDRLTKIMDMTSR